MKKNIINKENKTLNRVLKYKFYISLLAAYNNVKSKIVDGKFTETIAMNSALLKSFDSALWITKDDFRFLKPKTYITRVLKKILFTIIAPVGLFVIISILARIILHKPIKFMYPQLFLIMFVYYVVIHILHLFGELYGQYVYIKENKEDFTTEKEQLIKNYHPTQAGFMIDGIFAPVKFVIYFLTGQLLERVVFSMMVSFFKLLIGYLILIPVQVLLFMAYMVILVAFIILRSIFAIVKKIVPKQENGLLRRLLAPLTQPVSFE